MYGIRDATATDGEHGIAGLVRAFVDLESLPAEGKHLGHEGHAIQLPVSVECAKDFFLASHLYPIAYA
jgi:hypothetical protein